LQAERPPGLGVLRGRDLAREDIPAPLVDELAERQKSYLGEGLLELDVDLAPLALRHPVEQADALQIGRRHAERERVTDALVEAVVGAALEEDRELIVVMIVVVVPELVVDRDEILLLGL